jgi:hypothetical protein
MLASRAAAPERAARQGRRAELTCDIHMLRSATFRQLILGKFFARP